MRVIRDNALVEDDWRFLREIDSVESLPAGRVIVPYAFWLENRAALSGRDAPLGVCIDGDVGTEQVAEHLDCFELIALDFPVFTDGRSYSHARLLRERYGYRGELRAVGDVLRDQLFFMKRCGIDSFTLREDQDADAALDAFEDFSVRYQGAVDDPVPLYRRR